MDISSLVAAHLSADNQPKFDPEEFDLAMREAEDWREWWLGRLAWIKLWGRCYAAIRSLRPGWT